jgi:hypothetical protein
VAYASYVWIERRIGAVRVVPDQLGISSALMLVQGLLRAPVAIFPLATRRSV